ncbi:phosphoribosylanthranilate isomerase [Deinobacterium chartae]|uniref:N-(5'-phosphoribosyl)anthranilate isomerase n=1 Tax=Deinobacterium chartae TaxID=521158 RepID=A0A841HZA8_9DEIO|nr:phosphoribosylanthranilate isomerase [Deinobacterium chartae]MBB6098871.1 phosphoribosylanthranilate isomerase [Deinobacterium chartae]
MTRIRVKFCGMTREADAALAAELGVDAIGLIFAPSRRRISACQARRVGAAAGFGVLRVGVFVDAPLDELLRTADRAGLDAVQLHGTENEAYQQAVAAHYPLLRALRVEDERALASLGPSRYTVLLDGLRPGSGEGLNWPSLRAHPPAFRFWLAGGLGPENVGEAIRILSSAGLIGVDAVSRLEAAPGVKDPQRMRDFMREVKVALEARQP